MSRIVRVVAITAVAIASAATAVLCQTGEPPSGPPPPPPARLVPGLNAPDPHPNACVDCHTNMKEFNLDVRLTTLMKQWTEGVEPGLLAAARAAAPDSTRITGRHPKTSSASGEVPRACLSCHGRNSTLAPPFARLMHLVHLTGGDANLYMAYYQGDCTHCHKLEQPTGRWTVASAKEPPGD